MQLSRTWGAFGIAALLLLVTIPGHADSTVASFVGHYELADTKAGRDFILDVKQTDPHRAEISFSAAMEDGSGSAPDGEGKGKIEDGVLSCKFTDSFDNEGTCTLALAKHGYELDMIIIKVVDPRPFHFYGNVLLKKTAK